MRKFIILSFIAVQAIVLSISQAQTISAPFDTEYSLFDFGSVPGVPTNYGGITFKYDDPDVILIGGNANNSTSGAIYAVDVIRDPVTSRITGFDGDATLFSTAPNIDGGLAYGPGNVLFYTGYSNNVIGQIKPGSTTPDKITALTALGVTASTGTLQFVPDGFAGAGSLIVASFNASVYYRTTLTLDGDGTYNFDGFTSIATLPGGPEGMVFLGDDNPLIDMPSLLVSEYGLNRVSLYDLDVNGVPIVGTRQNFITGLIGAEGAVVDPITGDFFFSTFGSSNRLIRVDGFVPEPGTAGLAALGLLSLLSRRRR